MLAAPAQAETWSCSYHDKVKQDPMPFSFVRNGGTLDVPVFMILAITNRLRYLC
jgi:hypothetical protein